MKIHVGVLFGGKSVEHEISIISAIQAISYLDTEKYEIVPIYITKDNQFYTGEQIGAIEEYRDIDGLLKKSQKVTLVYDNGKVNVVRYPAKPFSQNDLTYIDIAFPIVHGTNVEDGALQGYLKTLNLPFVGPEVLASAVGMDKYVMKTMLTASDIPVLPCVCFTINEFTSEDKVLRTVEEKFTYPVIIKPVNLGSSIGISKADDQKGLLDGLELAFTFADKVLVEPAIKALKEINCSVLGDSEEAEASECEEPINTDEILSYEDKYIGGSGGKAKGKASGGSKGMAGTKRKIPADIEPAVREEIRAMAVKAFKALDGNGVSRIDFMIDKETGKIWLNEINTIPGSLAFYLWEPVGVSYDKLLDRMISLALKKQRQQEDLVYSFKTNVLSGITLSGGKGTKK